MIVSMSDLARWTNVMDMFHNCCPFIVIFLDDVLETLPINIVIGCHIPLEPRA